MTTSRILTLAAASAALAAGIAPAAASARSVAVSLGDTVVVPGTRIQCLAITSSGKAGVACLLVAGGKPVAGSVGSGLAVDGTAVLTRVKADGSASRIAKRRSVKISHAARTYTLRPGDQFGMAGNGGTTLGCKVLRITDTSLAPVFRGVRVSCWRATDTAVPRSYGTTISDRMAGLFRFDAKGAVEAAWGILRRQP